MRNAHRQKIVLNGYRRAARLTAEAHTLHTIDGNSDAALAAYRRAADAMLAARHLEKMENLQ